MSVLGIDDFPAFFQAITGYPPFRWQERLAREVAMEGWPDALDLPTASGKTACLEIAVFTLALQASDTERWTPRRIFFVVDRRIVVDQAHERAGRIALALSEATRESDPDSVVRMVAERLLALGGHETSPLGHERLRGGIPRRNAWSRSPAQPAIVTSTVDQIGSRLLFRNYDGSANSASIQAGLVANDTLILLDEAHCARPFRETIRSVGKYRDWANEPLRMPFGIVLLSATLPTIGSERTFRLNDEERAEKILRERIEASKPAELVMARKAKIPRGGGREDLVKARSILAGEIAERALSHFDDANPRRIAIMVNRVATAVEVRDLIVEKVAGHPADVVLMTGRMRPIDRDDLVEEWGERLRAGTEEVVDRSVFVVSTQSLEVGADFDFDVLISEAAPLDALRQRFGRLDRLGRLGSAAGSVVIAAYQQKDSAADPVYGEALAATWKWLTDQATDQTFDFGIASLERHLNGASIEHLQAPTELAPVLLPAHIDRWVQTHPIPEPDPDPAVFLHGARSLRPEVHLLWRLDLDPEQEESGLIQSLTLCPPSAIEALPVSIAWVRRWMNGFSGVPAEEVDVEGLGGTDEQNGAPGSVRGVLLWRGPRDSKLTSDPSDLRPGDFVVVPGSDTGPFGDLLRWERNREPVLDLGDRAQLEARGRAVLRIHPQLIPSWPFVSEAVRDEAQRYATLPEEGVTGESIRGLLRTIVDSAQESRSWLLEIAQALLTDRRFAIEAHPLEKGGVVLVGRPGLAVRRDSGALEESVDADTADRWSEGATPVGLVEHSRGVEAMAAALARQCGIPEALQRDLALAARLHDLGKADPRFQAMLRGDAFAYTPDPDDLLAKSGAFPTSRYGFERLASAARLPVGFRHELVSVRLAESSPGILDQASDPDLVLHLVASHHGRCRPFAPVVPDDDPVLVECEIDGQHLSATSATGLERLNSGSADRFWGLVRRYGWWGLAYLEGILRTSDHRQSEMEAARKS